MAHSPRVTRLKQMTQFAMNTWKCISKWHVVQMLSTLGSSTYFFLLLVPERGWNETDPWAVVHLMHFTKGLLSLLVKPWRNYSKNSLQHLLLSCTWSELSLPSKPLPHWFSFCVSSTKLILTKSLSTFHSLCRKCSSPRSPPNGFFLSFMFPPFSSLMTCS